MAHETRCLTDGAEFSIKITSDYVQCTVKFPEGTHLALTEDEAEDLEGLVHNAMEMALAPYWQYLQNRRWQE